MEKDEYKKTSVPTAEPKSHSAFVHTGATRNFIHGN